MSSFARKIQRHRILDAEKKVLQYMKENPKEPPTTRELVGMLDLDQKVVESVILRMKKRMGKI